MSNSTQNEISDSRLRKGKEKEGERSSKERSEVWDYFTKVRQPDGSQKAKCNNCEKLFYCHSKKHGTNSLKNHLDKRRPDGSCPKRRQKKPLDVSHPKRRKKAPEGSFPENNLDPNQHIHQNDPSGHDMQNNQEIPIDQHMHSECDARTNEKNHLGSDLHIDPEIPGYEENRLVYDQQKNRELFVRMIIDNKSMLEHVKNPFLIEFANTLQPSYSPLTLEDVEEECLRFYQVEKDVLKDKFSKLTSKISVSYLKSYNPARCGYFNCLATHFIDNDFKLVKRIISSDANDVERIMNDWGISKKVFAETYNGSYLFWRYSNDIQKLKCIAPVFYSNACEFYYKIYPAITSITTMMQDLNEFPEKMCYFNQIASEFNLPPKFEFVYNRSGVMGPGIHIINDACNYKNVITAFRDMNFEWTELEEVVGILNQINGEVVMISSLELPTSNLLHKIVFGIRDVLSRASPVFSGTKDAILWSITRLDQYLVSCNKIILIASLLDPRFKLRFIERCDEMNICKEEKSFECFNSLYIKYSQRTETHTAKCWEHIPELKNYLQSSSVEEGDGNFDVLGWWKDNKSEYPILSTMVRDILAIPISSTILSVAEPVDEFIDEILASKIERKMCDVLVCCNNWLRSDCSAGKFAAGIENIIGKGHINRLKHSNKGNSCVYDEKKCKELLVKLVISSKISFHFVENNWFIEWAKNLQPSYNPIDLATIKGECLSFYLKERQRLQNDLKKRVGGVCISAHIYHEEYNYPGFYHYVYQYEYIYVTTHYIDDHFNLVRRIIGTSKMSDHFNLDRKAIGTPGMSEQLLERKTQPVERCIANWGTQEDVLAFTSNIDKNEDIGWKYSFKLTCVHKLFVNLSELMWFEFHEVFKSTTEMVESLGKYLMMKFKGYVNSSRFYLPVKHREWAHTFYDALVCAKISEHFVIPQLTENWKEVFKFIKPIYEAFNILSSSKNPCSNLVLKIIFEIRDALSYIVLNTSFKINKLIFLERLLKRIDDYLKGCNNILLVASVLDPRFKKIYMDRCYREHISDKVEIDKCISGLLDKYGVNVRQEGRSTHGAKGQLGMLELERYLEHQVEVTVAGFDVLKWWEKNKSTYPTLARMARDILAIPVSSVSLGPTPFENLVNHFGPKAFEAMVCSNNWLSVNDEKKYWNDVVEMATINLAREEVPPSYQCPLRVCDVWSLNFLRHAGAEMSKEIVAIGVDKLTVENMQCLIKPVAKAGLNSWIPDDVINCYIGIINNQRRTSGNVLILNTFDTQQLQSWAPLKDESEKPSECIKRGNDFLEKELVVFPICLNNHWFVGVINTPKKKFQILDSLNSVDKPYKEATKKLRLGIQVCIDTALDSKKAPLGWRPEKVLTWPIRVIQNLPQQNDSCSCGLFALKYMQFWDGSELTSEFTQVDIDLFRKQIVGELIFSELNERKDIQNEVRKEEMDFNDSEDESDDSEDESDTVRLNSEDENKNDDISANLEDNSEHGESDNITANSEDGSEDGE